LAKEGGKTAGQYNCKFLPPEDNADNHYAWACGQFSSSNDFGMTAGWGDLQDGDELYIGAHGGARDSSQVAWVHDGTKTWWNAERLSTVLSAHLLDGSAPFLEYHLYACFGANNYYKTGECFGVRLRREMMGAGLRGRLTAYNGAVGLNGNGGHQVGSSRITCAFWYLIGRQNHNSGATRDMGTSWDLHPYTRTRGVRIRKPAR
jgi:hypothetical protein